MPDISLKEIEDRLVKNSGWIDGIVISGGEPTLHPQLKSIIGMIRKFGYMIKLDTNGSCPAVLRELINDKLIDYIAMDFKAPLKEQMYSQCIGINSVGIINKISDSIQLLLKEKIDYEFRVTIYPGILKTEHIVAMAKEIKGAKRFILQNFKSQITLDPKLKDLKPYEKRELEDMRELILPYVKECMVISS